MFTANEYGFIADNADIFPFYANVVISAHETATAKTSENNYLNDFSRTSVDFDVVDVSENTTVFLVDYFFTSKIGNTAFHIFTSQPIYSKKVYANGRKYVTM